MLSDSEYYDCPLTKKHLQYLSTKTGNHFTQSELKKKKGSKYALLDGLFGRLKWPNTIFFVSGNEHSFKFTAKDKKKKISQMIKKPSKCTICSQKP